MLAGTARRLHRLRIGTLDSFFAELAGSFALEFRLPPHWRIADEHEDAMLRAQAIDSVLDNEDPSSLLTLVHALTRGETTRSLEREVREKVETLYSVYRESGRDAWYRIPRLRELAKTALAQAIDVLRAVPLPPHKTWEKNHAKDVEAAEAGDWLAFITGGIAGKVVAGEQTYCRKPITPPIANAYQSLVDHARAVVLNQLANQTEATCQLLEKFDLQYQHLKSQTGALRFDDITYHLLPISPKESRGDGSLPLAPTEEMDYSFRLDSYLHHLLLDEFQDTSLAQWSIIRPFAKRITEAGRPLGAEQASLAKPNTDAKSLDSFFCVGDTKQAIYGWRGGVSEIFDAVTRELHDIHEEPLDTSWRSSPHVIAAVNQIFENVHRHTKLDDLADAVTRWQRQFHEHHTAKPKQRLNGYVCLQAARSPNRDETDSQQNITLRFAAEEVAKWHRRAPGFTIGVLVRRNDAVRRLIYELRELGIEASEEGGSSLDDSAAVQLILSVLQLADHPNDLVARFHVGTSPLANALGVNAPGESSVPSENEQQEVESLSPAEFAARRGNVAAGRLARGIRRQLADAGYGPTVYGLARSLAAACNRRELRRLEKLIGLAYQYDGSATSRSSDFVAYVESAKVRDPIAADVRVMTVHQAKGLEFDIVVVAELEAELIGQRNELVVGRPSPTEPIDRVCRRCNKEIQQLLPESWQRLFRQADDRDVAESLCVLYVAVTRAVHALQMIVAPSAENERSLHKTFGGLLRAALTDGGRLDSEQIAYETGDPQWFKNPGADRPHSAAEIALESESLAPLEISLAAPADRRWRGLQRISPSGLEGGTHVRLGDTQFQSGVDRDLALARGTLIHAWFEQIQWLDKDPPSDDRLREVAAGLSELAFSTEAVERLLIEFRGILEKPEIAACLRHAAYPHDNRTALNVENERRIAFRCGDQLITGSIDRLVTAHSGGKPISADIIDFKTDFIDNDKTLEQKVEFYRPQLAAYSDAVAAIYHTPREAIRSRLLFVTIGAVEEV